MPWGREVSNGLNDPSLDRFVRDASDRLIAAFFLGWLFLFACERLVLDPVLANAVSALFRRVSRRRLRPNSPNYADPPNIVLSEKSSGLDTPTNSLTPHSERSRLTFSMTICFAMAALADAISLGNFSAKSGSAACAFLVAWATMAAQAARITGLLKLSFDLVALGVKRWQLIAIWSWLCAGIVLMFVNSATSVGNLADLDFSPATAVCNRKHFLPTSIPLSLVNIVIEAFCSIKFFLLAAPDFLSGADRLRAVLDIGVLRALSLLLLDLLTIAPAAAFFTISADFVPFSIGALFVVAAFNYRPRSAYRASSIAFTVSPSPGSRIAPLVRLSTPERPPSRLSLGSLVHPPVSRLHRSLPPTPRHSTGGESSYGSVLHIRDLGLSSSASPSSAVSKEDDARSTRRHPAPHPSRAPLSPPPGIPLPPLPRSPPRAQELTVPDWRGSVVSPSSEGGTLEPAIVKLAYREALQAFSRDNYPPWKRSSIPSAPQATARNEPSAPLPRVPSSIIEFASPSRTSTATTLGHSTAHRGSPASQLPPVDLPPVPPQISIQLPSAASPADHHRIVPPPQSEAVSPAGSSVIFGSDVVRGPQRSNTVSTRDIRASIDSALPSAAPTVDVLRRASTISSRIPRPSEDLSVVYEDALLGGAAPARYRPTFGESAFRSAGVLPRDPQRSDSNEQSDSSHPSHNSAGTSSNSGAA
ncbi:hypothetical protein EXIGLDRAFT_716216 [Exidia glandulosa HHB12029]|uniref:Uncharacterized protein n=1 Tax=Exidia glandulosa HHB12029 TaxID=1314781 RepID=A0A165QXY9_EXIGL|nr:hypothetical protein EXIGLDRAFT_716216 [Exidia glandulosa HHB12029]